MKSGVAALGGTTLLTLESPHPTYLCSFSPTKSNTLITQSSIPSISAKSHRLRLILLARAVDSSQPTTTTPTNKDVVPDNEFSLAKVSFGVIGLGLGISLLSYGFGAYFNILPGSEWSAIMLTYGFPLAIIGMALKYAELKPVPCITYSDAEQLREKCATPILKQNPWVTYFRYIHLYTVVDVLRTHINLHAHKSRDINNYVSKVRNDVTRYRYGDEQHLDEALKRIFQYGLGGGIPRRNAPILQMIREEVTEDGRYSLVLVFEAKSLELSEFEKRQAKFASFFGPGITAEIGQGENNVFEVRLISNTTS